MSNYTPTTAFGPKDTLPPSNPLKTIYGAQFDTEFNNIATAIATKYDSNTSNITLSGSLAAASVTAGSITAPGITLNSKPLYAPVAYVATSDQAITSSTTLVNATGVTATLSSFLTYLVQLRLIWLGNGLTTQGYKFQLNFAGTPVSQPGGVLILTGNGAAATTSMVTGAPIASAAISATPGQPDFVSVDLIVPVNTGGIISLQIAQNSSSASTTTLKQGSAMIITRLA